jgi:hypothetical protein
MVALAALSGGCTDAPFNLDWDHTFPQGLSVREDGAIRVTEDEDGRVTGSLSVRAGRQSGRIEVVFLDEKGAPIVPADDEHLEVLVTFSDLATFQQTTPGAFSGYFHGLIAGQTSVYFKLKEGKVGGGTGLWTSQAIDLRVAP